jgi:hypothetical protein
MLRHIAVINDLKSILESMWYSGVITKVPYPEFKIEEL